MNKKFFGIKLSTILTLFVCLIVSIAIWMLVKYQLDAKNMDAVFTVFPVLALLRG